MVDEGSTTTGGRVTARRASCVLLRTDEPCLGDVAENFAASLFDIRLSISYPEPTDQKISTEVKELVRNENIDYIFSFLNPVIVPDYVLREVRLPINFHPAPPRWPGLGAPAYALYHGEPEFGVTAHFMEPLVDSGEILRVNRFPILSTDTQDTLLSRARAHSLILFFEVLTELSQRGFVKAIGERWERSPISKRAFLEWMTMSTVDTHDEVERKIKACRHPNLPGPFMRVHGHLFSYYS